MVHKVIAVILPLALVLLLLLDSGYSAPITGISGRDQAAVETFMMQYGYLAPKDPRLGESRTPQEFNRGIKQLQEFAGLKATGKVDAATVKLIKTPRCSVPDFGPSDMMRKRRKRYALHSSVWKKLHLTYRVLNTSKEELTKPQVRTAIRRAFDMWTKVSPLTFKEVFSGEADVRISFERGIHGDGYSFDGRGNKIAHAFFPHTNVGEDGDVHFDDEEHWTLNNPDRGTDFMWTAVHEIGHAIGVDHSTYWDAIMYPYYTGYKENLNLHEDDIMAIQAKYGKPRVPTTAPPKVKPTGPSPCKTSFDAVFHSKDGNTYFFKHKYFWTLDKYNRMLGARLIKKFWPKLRAKIQAAYTRRDGMTVFFKKRKYWVFEGTKYVEGPNDISEYGLPDEMEGLDAVFTWGGNGKTYFFKGNKYWRYNEKLNKTEDGYPNNISESWGAVSHPIDSVMTWKDGNTYFFKGTKYSKYEYGNWQLYKPKNIGQFFFNCTSETKEDDSIQVAAKEDENLDEDLGKNGVTRTTVFAPSIALLAIAVSLCNYW